MEQVGGDIVGIWRKHRISGELTREKIERVRVTVVTLRVIHSNKSEFKSR